MSTIETKLSSEAIKAREDAITLLTRARDAINEAIGLVQEERPNSALTTLSNVGRNVQEGVARLGVVKLVRDLSL